MRWIFLSLVFRIAAAQTAPDPALDALAKELIAAPDATARQRILGEHPNQLGPTLVSAIHAAGNAQYAQNRFDSARAIYAVAGEIAQLAHDHRGYALSQSNTGTTLLREDRVEEALPWLERALPYFHSAHEYRTEGRILTNIAQAHLHENRFAEAQEAYTGAEAAAEAAKEASLLAAVLTNEGNFYNFWGKYDLAAQKLNQALAVVAKGGTEKDAAAIQSTIAATYFALGDYPLALSAAEESLRIRRKINDHYMLSNVLDQIAEVHATMGHIDQARAYLDQAAAEATEQRELASRATILYDYAYLLWWRLHDNAGAAAKFRDAFEAATEAGRKSLANLCRVGLATVALTESRWSDAVKEAQPALELGRQTQDPKLIEIASFALASALEALHQDEQAESAWRDCIAAIELQSEHAAGAQESQAQFMKDKLQPYSRLSALLLKRGQVEEALQVTERGKNHVIVNALRTGRVEVDRVLTQQERDREASLRAQIASLQAANAMAQLGKARTEYRVFRNQLYAAHPELRVHRVDLEPASPSQMMASLPDRDAAVLEYVSSDSGMRLFVITNSAEGAVVRVYPIAVKTSVLAEQVARFSRQIAERDLGFRTLSATLYRELMAPAAGQLRGKKSLVIVPDSFLWMLPFQALEASRDRFLIEDHAVCYTPSLTVLHAIAAMRGAQAADNGSVLILGAADVSEREVSGLRQIYGASRTRTYLGDAASVARLRDAGTGIDVLHISAHGVFRDDDPMSSYLTLGGGRMEARDFLNLSVRARLAVLSGCETGKGQADAGEGLIGMSWGLFVAGTPTTVASQFKVDAESTAEWMLRFHSSLHGGGHPAAAMRQASLDLMRRPEFRHPFHWAGFIVLGEGF